MPEILKQLVTNRSAWTSEELTRDKSWVYEFSGTEINDLEAALRGVQRRGLGKQSIKKKEFPLGGFTRGLFQVRDELIDGRGLILLRGLPLGRFTDEDAMTIYWGIGAHLGIAVSQNGLGETLTHVRDEGLQYGEMNVRGYKTRARLLFHNDPTDVVGLLCLRKAKSGGLSLVSSAATLYNTFLKEHPELLDVLYRGFHYHLREEVAGGGHATDYRIPVFSYFRNCLSFSYVRHPIELATRKLGSKFTDEELAAMDLIESIAASQRNCLRMDFEPGDIQLLNNHATLHSRTEFEDHDRLDQKRDLVRLWLTLPEERPMAPRMGDRYGPGTARSGVPATSMRITV